MSLALPGSWNLFSHMQEALTSKIRTQINLKKGVHQALDDFRWLLRDITSQPTRMAEVVPLNLLVIGYHDAFGLTREECGLGALLLALDTQEMTNPAPIL